VIGLDTPVAAVLGDHPKKRKIIEEQLGIRTVGDLLRHFPRRYLRTAELTRVEELHEGEMLTVVGRLGEPKQFEYKDRRTGRPAYRVDTVVHTDGARLRMSFFAQKRGVAGWHLNQLTEGRRGIFVGKASRFRDEWQLTNPRMVLFGDPGEDVAQLSLETLRAFYPIYSLSKGLDSWDLQRAVAFALSMLEELPDLLPAEIRERHDLLDVRRALELIHAPDDYADVTRAQRRFRFEEALVAQLVLARRRRERQALAAQARTGQTRAGESGGLLAAFDARLPFELTAGQRTVGAEIEHDLAQSHPMHRLLQGEVGSGKTLVALRAMLRVVDSGGQAALLAPTEVLAQQHHRSITALLGDLAGAGMLGAAGEATSVELLTGSMTKTQRTGPMSRLASGEAGIVVGTHALLEQKVQFADLGLVVVDEQHRFGVEQRAALTDKAGAPPHVLVMTATPIPRTVAMTVFGDLETSVLTELPAGRAPIQTTVVPLADQPHWIDRVWERVAEEAAKGHQVYVVCPRISGDETEQGERDQVDFDEDGNPIVAAAPAGGLAAVEEVAQRLADGPLADLRIGRLHGRMPAEEKDRTMRDFAAGEIDVLVATTVIEVGVDVANATTMVILDADRFGISQLHQLRGRVGRGGLPGLCLLVSHAGALSPARERLEAVAATTDGFELSRADLEQRREGDVLGSAQSGYTSSLQSLRVLRDEKTIVEARTTAVALLEEDPELTGAPLLAAAVAALERSAQGEFLERS